MNKYLEKIAEARKDKTHTAEVLGGAATGGAIHYGTRQLQGLINRPLMNEGYRKPAVDKKTWKKILRDNKDLDVTFSHHKAFNSSSEEGRRLFKAHATKGGGAHAMPKGVMNDFYQKFGKDKNPILNKSYIYLGNRNTDVGIHEIGHVRQLHGNKYVARAKLLSKGLSLGMSRAGVGSVVGGAMLASDKHKGKAWVAPLAVAAPMMYDEGMANYHGYKMLSKHGTPAMKKRFLRIAAGNTLSYGGGAALASGALYAASKFAGKNKDHKK